MGHNFSYHVNQQLIYSGATASCSIQIVVEMQGV